MTPAIKRQIAAAMRKLERTGDKQDAEVAMAAIDRAWRAHPEDDLQAACIQWVRLARKDVIVFAIPNGGRRGRVEAARLIGLGVLPGVADLAVLRSNGSVGFIEIKAGAAKLSEAQEWFAEECAKRGILCGECRSLGKFQVLIESWCGPSPNLRRPA